MAVKHLYEFGPFLLDTSERLLLRDNEPLELTAKVFDLLALLVEHQGKLLEKDVLLKSLWPDSFVEEVNLSVNISALRKALGETASNPQYIETVPRRGYRFMASVSKLPVNDEPVITEKGVAARKQKRVTAKPFWAAGAKLWIAVGLAVLLAAAAGSYLLWIREWGEGPKAIAEVKSIAVLPFKTLTGDDFNQALGFGMADALITRLSGLKNVTVRPTGAVLKYSDAETDPLAAGRALGVDAVLDGRVQRDDKKIRVTAQLLKVEDGTPLWAGKFDDFFTNLFAVQDSISEKMAAALEANLTREEQRILTRRYTESTEAYQLYLQGRFYHFKYQFTRALEFYQASTEKDPDFALAHTGLATCYVALGVTRGNRDEMRDKAMEAANMALGLDPSLDEAHNALGFIKLIADWDWAGAEESLGRALELNPNNADARANYSTLLSILGEGDRAVEEMERARQLDPVSSEINFGYGFRLYLAGRYDEAMRQINRAIEMDPHFENAYGHLVRVYVAQSKFTEAVALAEKMYGPDFCRTSPLVAYAYAQMGRRDKVEEILQNILKRGQRPESNSNLAQVYSFLGRKDEAFARLEKAFRAREVTVLRLKVDPLWDNLRSDERFTDMLRRMRLL